MLNFCHPYGSHLKGQSHYATSHSSFFNMFLVFLPGPMLLIFKLMRFCWESCPILSNSRFAAAAATAAPV
jgi:hypothetical protein